MKTKVLTLAIALLSSTSYAQTAIPDANFENYLEYHDANGNPVPLGDVNSLGDGDDTNFEVPTSKIIGVTSLVIPNKGITDLTGIEAFTSLQILNCWGNALGSLNLSSNTNLITLTCNNCSLTSLLLPPTGTLQSIECFNNNLMDLDTSDNTNLETLFSFVNPNLGSLNLENNVNLKTLDCRNNGLTALDVTNNPALLALRCQQNSLSTLDLSNNTLLLELNVRFTGLTELDVSMTTQLASLNCSLNGLTQLNIQNGHNDLLNTLDATDNSLTCIQVDDVSEAEAKPSWQIDDGANYMLACSLTTLIPDAVFEQSLVDQFIDKNGMTGDILNADALPITFLSVSGLGITDLSGIEAFTSLQYLYCNNNSLTSLDLSSNPTLEILYCNTNSLTTINVESNPALTNLVCGENYSLTGIDLTQNTNLIDLSIQYNGSMTSLDVSNNTALKYLNTWLAPIGTLDLTQNTALETLNCMSSSLTELNVTQNLALTSIDVRGNQLTSLDLSQNENLFGMLCSNNLLESLNVKNGNNINVGNGQFSAVNNPDLECINVDNQAYSEANWFNIDSPDQYFSENCILGVEDNELATIKIFPNPTKDKVYIELKKDTGYSLTNLFGQEIRKGIFVLGNNELDIQTLSNGLYFLNLNAYSGNVTKKILKD